MPSLAGRMIPLTSIGKSEMESASVDLMDAILQLLLAITWQNERSDGLSCLRGLARKVEERVAGNADIFESEQDRSVAASQIIDALQDACRQPRTERHRNSLNDWSITPGDLDLPRLHEETAAPYEVARGLVEETKKALEARIDHKKIVGELRWKIRVIGERERFPFHVPALAAGIMNIANRPGLVLEAELVTEVASYIKLVERLAANTQAIKRMEIVAELLPVAERVCLQIDQSYSWSVLAINAAIKTSIKALRIYTQLNFYGLVSDARFSRQVMKTRIIPEDFFQENFTIWFMRASTLMSSGDDRETRAIRRSIVDAQHADVRVHDKQVLNSLVLLAPLGNDSHDIERQLALFLIELDSAWRRHHVSPEASANFFEKLPEDLRNLVIKHGMRRKVVGAKKTLMFCLAGLVAENVYRYRDRHERLLGAKGIKNRGDVDDYVAGLLREHGFQYKAETLRRKRAQWRRDFLDRVPEIFGLDEA